MKREWFSPIVSEWAQIVAIDAQSTEEILADLALISARLGGRVFDDSNIDEELAADHARRACRRALNGVARRHAKALRPALIEPMQIVPRADADPQPFEFLSPSTLRPRLNINTANYEQLEALPGIGPVTSKRIVAMRATAGAFRKLSDVKAVQGISDDEIEKFAGLVYVGPATAKSPTLSSPALQLLLDRPTFENYLRLLSIHGIGPWSRAPTEPDLGSQIAKEVRALRLALESWRGPKRAFLPGAVAAEVEEYDATAARSQKIENRALEVQSDGVLLDDSMYPAFVTRLLASAAQEISIVMFFARFEDEPDYPTDPLFRELAAAHNRGVRVRVLLDTDAEDSAIGARAINRNAHDYLSGLGIEVAFDKPNKLTHSKLVMVDNSSVIIGSHNWTAGSFYAYQDTSAFIHGAEVGAFYKKRFDKLWDRYAI